MITCTAQNLHESFSLMFCVDILFLSKQEEKSVIGVRLFNLFPIKISLCKQFSRIKCCSLETSGKIRLFLPCFKMFTLADSCNKRTYTGSNRSSLAALRGFILVLEAYNVKTQHNAKQGRTVVIFYSVLVWSLRHATLGM